MINDQPTILLCFYGTTDDGNMKRCRSLIRKNDVELKNINNFSFEDEFDLDKIVIPDSKYDHVFGKLANYQGYPLILGGLYHVKLEMLITTELSLQWTDQTDYPYDNEDFLIEDILFHTSRYNVRCNMFLYKFLKT